MAAQRGTNTQRQHLDIMFHSVDGTSILAPSRAYRGRWQRHKRMFDSRVSAFNVQFYQPMLLFRTKVIHSLPRIGVMLYKHSVSYQQWSHSQQLMLVAVDSGYNAPQYRIEGGHGSTRLAVVRIVAGNRRAVRAHGQVRRVMFTVFHTP